MIKKLFSIVLLSVLSFSSVKADEGSTVAPDAPQDNTGTGGTGTGGSGTGGSGTGGSPKFDVPV